MGMARKIIFIGGPACGRQIEAHRPVREYTYQETHVYSVVDEGGMVLRAWYVGVESEVSHVDSH